MYLLSHHWRVGFWEVIFSSEALKTFFSWLNLGRDPPLEEDLTQTLLNI